MTDHFVTEDKEAHDLEAKAKLERTQELEDVKALFSIPAGRRFLYRIVSEARLVDVQLLADERSQSFWLGQKNFAARLFDDMAAVCPSKAIELMVELSKQQKV